METGREKLKAALNYAIDLCNQLSSDAFSANDLPGVVADMIISAKGCSLQNFMVDLEREITIEVIRKTHLPGRELASLLGFSSPVAFRAFLYTRRISQREVRERKK